MSARNIPRAPGVSVELLFEQISVPSLYKKALAGLKIDYAIGRSDHRKMSSVEHRDILLIEDNPANIMVAKEFLNSFAYNYIVAMNGLEGIDQFKQFRFDLILMDIQMPGLSGIETAHHLRDLEKESGAKATPIVAMTASYATSDLDKWMAAGIEDVIPKPFNVKYFEKMLSKYCRKTAS